MSMSLMAKAMGIKVGNPLRKLVLIKLADNANDKGECWPSYQHIADQCEIGRSTVKSHIRALEDMGMLRREYRRNGDLNQSNVFYLNLDNPTPKPSQITGSVGDLGQELPEGVGQEMTEGRAGAARGGGAGAAPITSHSFEPVIEPKETPVADAPSEQVTALSRYAFEGKIVKLNHDDFQRWAGLYSSIDLVYELQKLDIEFTHEKPKNWFITASQKLSYQNKQAAARGIKPESLKQTPHWNSREGWEDFL
ncbi:helix-turn-helix domain-containing protein [uncultured Cedecea sp.]|uniref:helix-turn-helix domain-containing protein n=1 Tax=uncultured Cedecea sp. TaxID=988762 RepID=UPI002602B0EF|nr:helix-turn-helix domain-containing protein [uncultured Cedecea sp.]